ncbi:MAG TPA: sigma-70 family RNA polymerase sigma factor [Gemmataceae bacterium]
MTDGELLARFLGSRDDGALAALVRRHAPMVWGVCRRLLHNHQDAEDAFQATFLVLVRKAADVPRQAVAKWLYGVARQTAVRLRATTAKRGRRETQVVNMPEPTVAEVRDADLGSVLDEELSRLPDRYRAVLVLCDLEGETRKEAARHMGLPEGTVGSRLARARALLAKRLAQRGVVLSGGALAGVLAQQAVSEGVPKSVVDSTIKAASLLAAGKAAATGAISVTVAALTEGMVKAMFVTKIKSVLAVVLVAAALAGAAGLIYQTQAAEQKAKEEQPATKKDQKKSEERQAMAEEEKPTPTNLAKWLEGKGVVDVYFAGPWMDPLKLRSSLKTKVPETDRDFTLACGEGGGANRSFVDVSMRVTPKNIRRLLALQAELKPRGYLLDPEATRIWSYQVDPKLGQQVRALVPQFREAVERELKKRIPKVQCRLERNRFLRYEVPGTKVHGSIDVYEIRPGIPESDVAVGPVEELHLPHLGLWIRLYYLPHEGDGASEEDGAIHDTTRKVFRRAVEPFLKLEPGADVKNYGRKYKTSDPSRK